MVMAPHRRGGEVRIGLALLAVFLVYAGWNAREILAGPELAVLSPSDGQVFAAENPVVSVAGTAKRGISELSVNGGRAYADHDGAFAETFLLLPGENHFVVQAEDRFGRETSVERTVWLLPPEEPEGVAAATSSSVAL